MAWRDELQRVTINGKRYIGGSFRGVPFLVESSEYSGGRRLAEDSFPYSDEHFEDDLGRARREYPVTVYVIGKDYLAARDRLIAALEEFGPGELVHPYYGRNLSVRVNGTFTVSERREDGGRATFAINFCAANDAGLSVTQIQSVPAGTAQARAQLATAYQATAAANAVDGDFLTPIENAVKGFAAKVRAPFEGITKTAKQSAQFRSRVNALADNAASIVTSPVDLTLAVGTLLTTATFAAPALPSSLMRLIGLGQRIFDELLAENARQSPIETETRSKQTVLLRATADLLATSVALTTADLCAGAAYESYDDAVAVRSALGEALDARGNEPGFEDVRSSIECVRSASAATIPANSAGNFLRQFFTPGVTTPSIVLAYRFYGTSEPELRFVARNRGIQHPGFILGARPVEVLREL